MIKMITEYKGWPCFESLPEGWKFDKSAGSPLHGYEFITNGKSIINGGKRALCRVCKESLKVVTPPIDHQSVTHEAKEEKPVQVIDANYMRTVNELARKRFELKLLADIRVDLMVCEIEGWDKQTYIDELHGLINGLKILQSDGAALRLVNP